jgi:hypothetical protein
MIGWILANRTLAEAMGVVALIGCIYLAWIHHDHTEQHVGAEACIQATTETKEVAVADNTGIEAAHAAQLTKVVAVYEEKLARDSADNADLAQRLSSALHQNPAPHPGAAACETAALPGLPESESAAQIRLGRLRADLKFVLDACDADHERVDGLNAAYEDWRQKMIEMNAQR